MWRAPRIFVAASFPVASHPPSSEEHKQPAKSLIGWAQTDGCTETKLEKLYLRQNLIAHAAVADATNTWVRGAKGKDQSRQPLNVRFSAAAHHRT